MRRREVIGALLGAAAWPDAAGAQSSPLPVVGFLNGGSAEAYARMVAAFRTGLAETSFVEGQNVTVEWHWAEGRFERLPGFAAELAARRVAVIAATSTPAALAAKAATADIPIVFTTSGDPVRLGLVSGLSGQGGNVTGATQLTVELSPKRLALLREILPNARTLALLVNPSNPLTPAYSADMEAAAQRLGVRLHVLRATAENELEAAIATARDLRAEGLVIASADPFFTSRAKQLAALALRYGVPAMSQYAEFAEAGGLLSYGGSITESYRLAGGYVGQILKGARPGELPVRQSVKFELFVNLRTAKSLGLTVPPSLLAQADEVIE